MTNATAAAPLWHWPAQACDEEDEAGLVLLDAEAVGLDRMQYPRALFVCGRAGGWLSRAGLVSVFALSFPT